MDAVAVRKYLAVAIIILATASHATSADVRGIKVVTTFQYLADDVSLLLCDGDEVRSLVPAGVDPHEYSLSPKDVEVLRSSDLVISTSHTHLERKIEELKMSNELNVSLVEVPEVPNISIRNVPGTKLINYHAVTYDPENYLAFMKTVAEELSRLRPECSKVYEEKLGEVVRRISDVKKEVVGVKELTAVGSSPMTQYAVEWLGVKVVAYLVVNPEVSPTPGDVSRVEELISSRAVDVVVIVGEGSTADNALGELASKYSIPVLRVPSPIASGSTIAKLEALTKSFRNLTLKEAEAGPGADHQGITLITTFILLIVLMIALRRVKTWK